MKTLKSYLKECGANPCNTTGMGNVSFPTDTQVGSGDTFQFQTSKKKKKKHENDNELHIGKTESK